MPRRKERANIAKSKAKELALKRKAEQKKKDAEIQRKLQKGTLKYSKDEEVDYENIEELDVSSLKFWKLKTPKELVQKTRKMSTSSLKALVSSPAEPGVFGKRDPSARQGRELFQWKAAAKELTRRGEKDFTKKLFQSHGIDTRLLEQLEESVDYKKVFNAVAKHFGVSPDKVDTLDKDKKKEFFNTVEKCWDEDSDSVPESCPLEIN